jgi:uncharacterized protein
MQTAPNRRWRLFSLASTLLLLACSHTSSKDKAIEHMGTVVLETSGRTVRVEVEVVKTPEARALGLMYRKELPAQQGMLFVFEQEAVQSFWMKNTYIPLDMIFIDKKRRVVGIVHDAAPMTTTSRQVDAPSSYVLEVNAGFAKNNGIQSGAAVSFEGFTP